MTTRRSLKEYLANTLKGKTIAEDKVRVSRAIPNNIEDLPVINIYLKNEDVEVFDESPRRYKRVANFSVECINVGNTDDEADESVEFMVRQVEDALAIDETLGRQVSDSWLGNVNFQSDFESQSPVAAATLLFNVEYFVEASPKTDAPDFLRTGVDWQVGHHDESSDDVIDAQDELEIPQG